MAEEITNLQRPPLRIPWVLRETLELSTEAAAWFVNLLQPWEVGDLVTSGRPTKRGFLPLRGETIGREGSGADYEGSYLKELYELARGWAPNAGTENFNAGDLVTLPDFRTAVAKGRGTDAVGDTGGAATHDHSVPALSVPAHTHTLSDAGQAALTFTTNALFYRRVTQGFTRTRSANPTMTDGVDAGTNTTSVGLQGATDSGGSGSTGTGTTGSASSYPPYVTVNVFIKW